MNKKPFYITTTLPYMNARPHIGFALEVIRADAVARYKRSQGYDVFFNTGSDEHGLKIYQKAQEEGLDTKQFLDNHVTALKNLMEKLEISHNKFIRTTDPDHKKSAQKFWQICDDNGFIYKKKYKGLYCVGCEAYVTEKDLVDGECPYHVGMKLEEIEEENYFFKYSSFGKQLLKLYKKKYFVIPEYRLKEIKNFVEAGLEDFSISRLRSKMPWGIPVPGDDEHVMYVWFDALVNYISTLGWPDDKKTFKRYWKKGTPVQYCGKDNLQQQAARWQAMLMAVGLPSSNKVVVDGFITSNNQKMSKSTGNVIDPVKIIDEFGPDSLRYYLLREISSFEDSDFTHERFIEVYNANLANGIGNLTSRIMKMAEENLESSPKMSKNTIPQDYKQAFEEFDIQKVADITWKKIGDIDKKIQETQPFKLIKEDREKAIEIIKDLVADLHSVAQMLAPLLPGTSRKIEETIKTNKKPEPLFLRR